MKRILLALCALVVAAVCSSAAHADTFAFNFVGSTITGSGIFTATPNNATSYTITGITGTTNGVAISGLLAPGTIGLNDNQLVQPGPTLDFFGVGYSLVDGGQANLFGDDQIVLFDASGFPTFDQGHISIVATPEPATVALLSTGALGLVGSLPRRKVAA
jgi:hypothetical protein